MVYIIIEINFVVSTVMVLIVWISFCLQRSVECAVVIGDTIKKNAVSSQLTMG